ncbi:MAG: hypothetical protein JSS82_06830 [Bacteroidetes bacterium]|nr:hypothetical protein [Bacteroidota bacterium]
MRPAFKIHAFFLLLMLAGYTAWAQGDAKATARIDATKITVGDQARLFLEVQHDPSQSRLQWAYIPDTFNHLEVVEKGKIDTVKQGNIVTYKQRLLVTGFDSGAYMVPALVFPVIPNNGTSYTVQTDSFSLLVQTVAVDTSKGFRGIKGIMVVKGSWLDYIWLMLAAILFIGLIIFVIIYFRKNRKAPAPVVVPQGPVETLQEKTVRVLRELEQQGLWQKGQVKEYYTQLTDILRNYIEQRFRTPAMELTTDELLYSARGHKEMHAQLPLLTNILQTADLAKFAKAQPLPHEHTNALEQAIQFVNNTKPVVTETPIQAQ